MVTEANKKITMTVKNGDIVSKKTIVYNVMMQGDTLVPLIATSDMDFIAKEVAANTPNPYKYKGKVDIGSLGLQDDLLLISRVGVETTVQNSIVNVEANSRNLHFGGPKCAQILVGPKKDNFLKNEIKIDSWKQVRNNGRFEDVLTGQEAIINTSEKNTSE